MTLPSLGESNVRHLKLLENKARFLASMGLSLADFKCIGSVWRRVSVGWSHQVNPPDARVAEVG